MTSDESTTQASCEAGPFLCRVTGCNQKVQYRGLCHLHYQRAQKAGVWPACALPPKTIGTPPPVLIVNPNAALRECRIVGCTNTTRWRGLCHKHYTAAHRQGLLEQVGLPIQSSETKLGGSMPVSAKFDPEILKHVPWDDVMSTLDTLAESGMTREAAIDFVAGLLDKALPLNILVPAPAGIALEAIDGPVLRAAIGMLWKLAENRQARLARKAKREQLTTSKG